MCQSCWEEYGSPRIDTPAVRAAVATINDLYALCPTGGRCHVVVDDWNLEDHDLAYCEQEKRTDETPDEESVARACLAALRPLSTEERASALALEADYWQATR